MVGELGDEIVNGRFDSCRSMFSNGGSLNWLLIQISEHLRKAAGPIGEEPPLKRESY